MTDSIQKIIDRLNLHANSNAECGLPTACVDVEDIQAVLTELDKQIVRKEALQRELKEVEEELEQQLKEAGAELDKRRWRKVEDELPNHRNDVLIKSRSGCVGIGWWNKRKARELTIMYLATKDPCKALSDEMEAREITHWKPITPPEE